MSGQSFVFQKSLLKNKKISLTLLKSKSLYVVKAKSTLPL